MGINNSETNPSTGDNIKAYVTLSLISIIGITYGIKKLIKCKLKTIEFNS